jgi:general secretion pathway protein F
VEAFDYAAIDAKGARQRGTVMASSSRDARDMLRARALTPIDLTRSRKKTAQTSDASNSFFSGRIKLKDLTRATRQLAILISAATPVEDALRVIALQFEKSPMRGVLLSIRGQVMEGLKLSDALRSQPQAFDDLYIAMVASGETSGRLAEVLERQADDLEAAQAIRRKILGATVYPIVLSIVAIGVIAILMVLVIPKVVAQFDSFGQDLPPLTQFVIGFSEGFQTYGLWIGIGFCLMLFGFKFLLTQPAMRFAWDKMKLGLPLLGHIIRDLNAARFSRTMAGLLSAGMPALAALETSRHTLKNVVMRDAIIGAAARIREGAPISRALEKTEVFPPLVTQMVAGGEASGDTGDMFSRSADYLENEFEAKTSVFLTLLEPLIIIFLAGIVLVIIAAIFLPILTLNTFIL